MADGRVGGVPGSGEWTEGDRVRYCRLQGQWVMGSGMTDAEFLEWRMLRLKLRRLLVERLRAEDAVRSQPDVGALGQCEVWPVLVLVGVMGLLGLSCFLAVVLVF